MKKTINVNIGSVAFIVDEDAYYMLKKYLEDIESRFEPREARETVSDVEMRIADIFSETLSSPAQVVDTLLVRKAIAIIGPAEEFGEPVRGSRTFRYDGIKKLRRSSSQRVIGGVCGGIAEYFGVDVSAVRVLTFLLIFLGGISLWLYIILWIAIPSAE